MQNLGLHCFDESVTGNLTALNLYLLTPVRPIQAGTNG